MQSTKGEILTHLKRTGGSTVDGLATALGLARMTVRQHLAALERDRLVVSREERGRTGRPHLLFTLGDRGEEYFPKSYDRLADLVLQEVSLLSAEEIANLDPQGKKKLLLRKMAERVYHQHESEVRDKTLPERVALATNVLKEEGGFAEWRTESESFEIVDYNCIYRKVMAAHDDLCDFHLNLIRQLLGKDAQCTQAQSMGRGADYCRFIIQSGDTDGLGNDAEGYGKKVEI